MRLFISGPSTLVYIDINGDRIADMSILVQNAVGLQASDFLL